MSLKDISLKNCYDSNIDNILEDFYIPILQNSCSYDRIAGFFSSSTLAVAAKGMVDLLKNNGKIRMIISPRLSKDDIKTIKLSQSNPEIFLENRLLNEINLTENLFEKDCIFILGYLLSKKILEIKIVLIFDEDTEEFFDEEKINNLSLFHQKIGIFTDSEGNSLSFSGSVNETANGWIQNIEEFKVFKSWDTTQQEYFLSDKLKFEGYWNGKNINSKTRVKIIELPEAVKKYLVENKSSESEIEKYKLKNYIKKMKTKSEDLSLFEYQKQAVSSWKKNNHSLLFEMATGTGKTRTALGAALEKLKEEKKILVIVATPQNTLSNQWRKDVENLNLPFQRLITADSSNPKWRSELEECLLDLNFNLCSSAMIFTTHITSSKSDFTNLIIKNKANTTILFIGDEAHGFGASKNRNALLDIYEYKIGLSATPKRWFDDEGSDIVYKYFGEKSFEFGIKEALSTVNPLTGKPYLVNYYYYPIFVDLTENELAEYIKLTAKIIKIRNFSKKENSSSNNLETLLFKRSNIIKNAENKLIEFKKLLNQISEIQDTLIFTSPQQIESVMKILNDKKILFNKITQEVGTTKKEELNNQTEREVIIRDFKSKIYKALVAIKCLDEGIDIPTADTGIILSSSTNPREYIQRLGRVIRSSPEKNKAFIYDFIVVPNSKSIPADIKFQERTIIEKELLRVKEIAENALNNVEIILSIHQALRRD